MKDIFTYIGAFLTIAAFFIFLFEIAVLIDRFIYIHFKEGG